MTTLISGIRIAVMVTSVSVVISGFDKVTIESIKTMDDIKDGYQEIVRYLILTGIGVLLVQKCDDIVKTLNGR